MSDGETAERGLSGLRGMAWSRRDGKTGSRHLSQSWTLVSFAEKFRCDNILKRAFCLARETHWQCASDPREMAQAGGACHAIGRLSLFPTG